MGQIYAAIHIMVKSPDLWEKLFSMDLSKYWNEGDTGRDKFDISGCSFVEYEDEWRGMRTDNMVSFAKEISSRLGDNCIFIGKECNMGVDKYTDFVYYLGSKVCEYSSVIFDDPIDPDKIYDEIHDEKYWEEHSDEYDQKFEELSYGKMWAMYDHTCIGDIAECLSYYSLYGPGFNKAEQEYLKKFGYIAVKGEKGVEYKDCVENFNLPSSIELNETRYEGRLARIERVNKGDKVKLVREPDNIYNSNAIDVQNSEGSLGYLAADMSEMLAPLLDCDLTSYTAVIDSVTPLSKRPKYCKSAIISIHVEVDYQTRGDQFEVKNHLC